MAASDTLVHVRLTFSGPLRIDEHMHSTIGDILDPAMWTHASENPRKIRYCIASPDLRNVKGFHSRLEVLTGMDIVRTEIISQTSLLVCRAHVIRLRRALVLLSGIYVVCIAILVVGL